MSENLINCPHCGKPVLTPKSPDGISKEDVQAIVKGEVGDFCSRFPGLCGQVSGLEKEVKSIKEAVTSHPTPTEGLLKHWQECPECRPLAENLGLIKPIESKEEEEENLPFEFMKHK